MDALKADDERSAQGATGPRVSIDDIENQIAGENIFNVAQALYALGQPAPEPTQLLTVCVITLRNGFTVTGTSAPASAENFDPAKGEDFAKADARRQAWRLLGFALRDRLYNEEQQRSLAHA